MSASNPSPRRPAAAVVVAAMLLSGCQWLDTRPEVVITPAGDLVGDEFVDLQVEAGGAPQVQFLVDGVRFGTPWPTGQVIHLDLKALPEGEHDLVARIESGASPRTSAPRRLVRTVTPVGLPLRWTGTTDPWSPYSVEFVASLPMTDVRVTVTGPVEAPIPFTHQVSSDRSRVSVLVEGTLAGHQLIKVRVQGTGPSGEVADQVALKQMPQAIPVRVSAASSQHLDFVATPELAAPGASLWVRERWGPAVHVGDFGPSPWHVTLPDGSIGSGDRWFEFRRDDARFAEFYLPAVPAAAVHMTIPGQPATLTPRRCAIFTADHPVAGVAFRSSPDAGFPASGGPGQSWTFCLPETAWRAGPTRYTLYLTATSTLGLTYADAGFPAESGWEWTDLGADPVTDGVGPLSGRLLAVGGPTPETVRIGISGRPGSPDEGLLRVAVRTPTPGTFAPGDPLNPLPATDGTFTLGAASGLAWRDASGAVEGRLQEVLGGPWTPWPPGAISGTSTPGAGPPRVASDARGASAVAWTEQLGGARVIRVRTRDLAWGLLPPILATEPGATVDVRGIAGATPIGAGPLVTALEVSAGDVVRRTVILFHWDGFQWTRAHSFELPLLGAAASVTVETIANPSRLWTLSTIQSEFAGFWPQAAEWVGPPAGMSAISSDPLNFRIRAVGFPSDGRPPVAAWVEPSSTNPTEEVRIGPALGFHWDGTVVAVLPAGTVTSLLLDPDGMVVAWTDGSGTIHVRMLTP